MLRRVKQDRKVASCGSRVENFCHCELPEMTRTPGFGRNEAGNTSKETR